MIKGNKPSAYIETFDKYGHKITLEQRQCSHCQYTWTYLPDNEWKNSRYWQVIPKFEKKKKRAICLHCMGLVCGRSECMKSCAPFSEIALNNYKNFKLTKEGIYARF